MKHQVLNSKFQVQGLADGKRLAVALCLLALGLGTIPKALGQGETMETAYDLSVGTPFSGAIDWAGDLDYFRLQITSSGTLTAYTTGDTDVYGYLLDSSGYILISNDDNPYP
ncbi:MAG: hypothetical protein HW398_1149 [Acidobacteria bacterium]|nr:hypothetical protein [Acidobacteriota bacterium]